MDFGYLLDLPWNNHLIGYLTGRGEKQNTQEGKEAKEKVK